MVKIKDKILKATRKKWQIIYQGTPNRTLLISQQKLYKPEGNGMVYLKWWKGRIYHQEYFTQQDSLPGSSPSRIQGYPQDEWCQRVRDTDKAWGLSLKFIFAWPLYTLNNIFLGEVHIAYTQVISKHYSNLTFNRNRISSIYFSFTSLLYHLAFRPVNILWLAPGVTLSNFSSQPCFSCD